MYVTSKRQVSALSMQFKYTLNAAILEKKNSVHHKSYIRACFDFPGVPYDSEFCVDYIS